MRTRPRPLRLAALRTAAWAPALLVALYSLGLSCGGGGGHSGGSYGPARIDPPRGYALPGGTVEFLVLQANGTYSWSIKHDRSGGASIDATGKYTAGPQPNACDVVRASLPSGEYLTATVTVTMTPATPLVLDEDYLDVAAGGNHQFTVTGGSGGGYIWTIPSSESGGIVEVDGTYRAGLRAGTDVVQVADSAGQATQATITVVERPCNGCCGCGGTSGPLALSPLLLLWLLRRRGLPIRPTVQEFAAGAAGRIAT